MIWMLQTQQYLHVVLKVEKFGRNVRETDSYKQLQIDDKLLCAGEYFVPVCTLCKLLYSKF